MNVKRIKDKEKKYSITIKGKTIKFGAKKYRVKPGTKAGNSYCARSSGLKGLNNKESANYWSRRMWGCKGKKSYKQLALKA